jgi:hypothetical protein
MCGRSATVIEAGRNANGLGQPPFDLAELAVLSRNGYVTGIYSPRESERRRCRFLFVMQPAIFPRL